MQALRRLSRPIIPLPFPLTYTSIDQELLFAHEKYNYFVKSALFWVTSTESHVQKQMAFYTLSRCGCKCASGSIFPSEFLRSSRICLNAFLCTSPCVAGHWLVHVTIMLTLPTQLPLSVSCLQCIRNGACAGGSCPAFLWSSWNRYILLWLT